MRKRRTIVLLGFAIAIVVTLVIVVPAKPPPVAGAAQGRVRYDDDSIGFMFAVTNMGTLPLEVMVSRNNAPTGSLSWGYAYRVHTTMKPMAMSYFVLYPPPEGVPWSADVFYMAPPGKFERTVKSIGTRLRLCKPAYSDWKRVQRIEIAR